MVNEYKKKTELLRIIFTLFLKNRAFFEFLSIRNKDKIFTYGFR